MAADVGISANDDSHHLPPPLGGGGDCRHVLLLWLRTSYPPRRTLNCRPELRPRLRDLPVAQSAIRGAYNCQHSSIHCYGQCRFCHVMPIRQDSQDRHSLHPCPTSIFIFLVFIDQDLSTIPICFSRLTVGILDDKRQEDRTRYACFFINSSYAPTPTAKTITSSESLMRQRGLTHGIKRMTRDGMSIKQVYQKITIR